MFSFIGESFFGENMPIKSICRIRLDENDYKKVLIKTAQNVQEIKALPFLGAGISCDAPSFLPVADQITRPIIQKLWASLSIFPELMAMPKLDLALPRRVLEESRMERILDVLVTVYGNESLRCLDELKSNRWNGNHAAIAVMSRKGKLPFCITLNFDTLIEQAVAVGNSGKVHCPLLQNGDNFKFGDGPHCLDLIKPHGSFVEFGSHEGGYDYISTTLSLIGSKPSNKTTEIISSIISKCPFILVAGYSDDDWDVYPILVENSAKINGVVWIEYFEYDKLDCAESLLHLFGDKQRRVNRWLENLPCPVYILLGPSKDFFGDLVNRLAFKITMPEELSARDAGKINACHMPWDSSTQNTRIANSLAVAMLVQHTGKFSHKLLKCLDGNEFIASDKKKKAIVKSLLAHTKHTEGDILGALAQTKKLIKLIESFDMSQFFDLGAEYVWYGYQHFCALKPHKIPLYYLPICWLHYFVGRYYMNRGLVYMKKHASDKSAYKYKLQKSLVDFYGTDLLHNWAGLLMIFGNKLEFVIKGLFKIIFNRYSAIDNDALMSREYYWLRKLEAGLLADKANEMGKMEDIIRKIDMMENDYRILQNNVQIGNIDAYRALLYYHKNKDIAQAKDYIERADNAWRSHGEGVLSGKVRLMLYRAYMGIEKISFGKIREIYISN